MTDDAQTTLDRLGLSEADRRAWAASGRPADQVGAWATDRVARRPEGERAVAVYGAEDVHEGPRRLVLSALALGDGDELLEIGCGGGLLLRDATAMGARCTGLDHSAAMVRLARERAPQARVVQGSAERLPFADDAFSAVAMVMVLLFLDPPEPALAECLRVLRPGGRFAAYTTGPELRGTPALPEPVAAHARTYDDDDLVALLTGAGFGSVDVTDDGGGRLAVAVKDA